jgi:outer membrane receptor protein involved in Fe transport
MHTTSEFLSRIVTATLFVTVTPILIAPALAQDTRLPTANGRTIENIIVTAQKREQSLQDVPIVVTTVSEQLLKDTGVKDIKDLQLLTPGLIVTSANNEASTTARIRGIGTVGDNPGLESSVGVVVDGVYRPRNGVGFGDLGELERIEVLKGPQGTLFGKNTSAGVINVVSKKPAKEFAADAEITAGNYHALEGAASLTGPLSDTVATRVYFATRERDGLLDVRNGAGPRTRDDDYDRSLYTGRAQLLFTPSDSLEVRWIGDYSKRDESCCLAPQAVLTSSAAVIGALNATAPNSIANPADPFGRVGYANRSSAQQIEDKGTSLEINWDLDALGGATLTSVSAWRDWETINALDADFTTVDILYRDADGDNAIRFKQLSQEVRLAGDAGRLNWLVGAFYAGEDLNFDNEVLFGSQFQEYYSRLLGNPATVGVLTGLGSNAYLGGLGAQDSFAQESSSYALFSNNTLRLTDSVEFTLGVRYTDESKDLDSRYSNQQGGAGCQALRNRYALVSGAVGASPLALSTIYGVGCFTYADPLFNNLVTSQSIDESEWTGTAKLALRFSDQVMSYVSYARGYKAGGFNLDRERSVDDPLANNPAAGTPVIADTDTRFDEELVDSYEVGLKTQWLNDSLSLNSAVFYQDYTDFQLNTFTGLVYVVTSLPQVVSQGVDVDVLWYTPLEQLMIQGGVTYAETQIEDFGTAATLATFSSVRQNDTLSFAPEWSASLSATFEQPIAARKLLRANLGAKYTSQYNTGSNLAPTKLQEALTLVNARVSFGADDETWALELWSQNLTKEDYYQVHFDAALQGGTVAAFLGAPRTYGVTARFKF